MRGTRDKQVASTCQWGPHCFIEKKKKREGLAKHEEELKLMKNTPMQRFILH